MRFWDDQIQDMYTHNYTLIKHNDECLVDLIIKELALCQKHNKNFLRVESNFPMETKDLLQLNGLPIKPDITQYDYMLINVDNFKSIKGNLDCHITKATQPKEISDGIQVDVQANTKSMGLDFAQRRIARKARLYPSSLPLDFYVCYHQDLPIGKCELMISKHIAKIEDFDILPDYQRKGFGSSMLKHLLRVSNEHGVPYTYLITDHADTAKEMYQKCGFEKIGTKTELFFDLTLHLK